MLAHKIYILATVLFLGFVNTQAQEETDALEGYLKIAAQNNPALKASFNEYLAALERVPQVGSLPDPEGTLGFFLRPMELNGGNQFADIRLMQMFPWFGTLKAAKEEASQMAMARFEAFRTLKADLFFNVSASWYRLVKLNKKLILTTENLELLESMEKIALVAFQSNLTDLADVLRVKMEILTMKEMLALLKDQLETEQAGFNALLNRDQTAAVDLPETLEVESLPTNVIAVRDSILSNHPMLAMLDAEAQSFTAMEEKARRMGFPMVGLGLDYMAIGKRAGNPSLMNGRDMLMPMVSFTIPVYRKKYTAMENEARLLREATLQKTVSVSNDLLFEYRQLVQELADARRRIDLSIEQTELAEITMNLLLTRYSTTGSGYDEVLQIQSSLLDYHYQEIEAIADYNTAIAMGMKLMNAIDY